MTRRSFVLATGSAGLVPAAGPLSEHGFWDYTTPGAGGMEAFEKPDYLALLDDMSAARMNSLLICPKWSTTGYQSRLPYLDQQPSNKVIRSSNELLRWALAEAAKRGIKTWLSAFVTGFDLGPYKLKPCRQFEFVLPDGPAIQVAGYDLDTPGVRERAVEIFAELAELFPGVGGLCVELEDSGTELPHRIPLYNRWAEANRRPPFERLGHPINPRSYDNRPWRDYTTSVRIGLLQDIERAVRAKGFRGDLAMICETARTSYNITQEVNTREYHQRMPGWTAVTYEYDKWDHRFGMMDVCIEQPRRDGLRVYYLPRGVMTWGKWPLPISLEESWRMDVEDVRRFRPQGLWWFGCGTVNDGAHVSLTKLRQAGYRDGAAARRALLGVLGPLRDLAGDS
jgi:hypothetical protein